MLGTIVEFDVHANETQVDRWVGGGARCEQIVCTVHSSQGLVCIRLRLLQVNTV